jgi:hypothetical protein
MLTYNTIVPALKELFPEVTQEKDYIVENESLPYAFAADLVDYLRESFKSGKIAVDDPRVQRLFSILTEIESLPPEENRELVSAGFFESMLYEEPSDSYFIEAAKRYFDADMYRLFRITQTHYIGDPKDFVDPLHDGT